MMSNHNASGHPAIEVQSLSKIFNPRIPGSIRKFFRAFRGRTVVALNDVNLTIEQGEIFGLVGRNGQGKTTLIKSIASLLEPTQGKVSVLGHDTHTENEIVRRSIGLVSADERTFYGRLTGWQNLMFFARLYGLWEQQARKRIAELAEMFDFRPMLVRRFQELSSGNKQRMSLIRALLIDPPIILLDEPTRSLDPIAADELRGVIKDVLNVGQGKTIFITSHNLLEVEDLCTRVGFLSAGEVKLCATLAELADQYFSTERVALGVRGLRTPENLVHGDLPLPPLEWNMDSTDLLSISFRRKSGDDSIDRVLKAIIALNGVIVSCRTERDGLREIMNMFENNDRSRDNAAVANCN